jgi:hypothetical protein
LYKKVKSVIIRLLFNNLYFMGRDLSRGPAVAESAVVEQLERHEEWLRTHPDATKPEVDERRKTVAALILAVAGESR